MTLSTLGNSEYLIHHPNQVELYAVTREQLEILKQPIQSSKITEEAL